MWQGILFDDDKNGHFTKRFCHLQYLRLTHWDTVKGDAFDGNMIKFWWKWHINMISPETISKRLNSVQSNFSENWFFGFLPTNKILPNMNQVTSFTHDIQKNHTITHNCIQNIRNHLHSNTLKSVFFCVINNVSRCYVSNLAWLCMIINEQASIRMANHWKSINTITKHRTFSTNVTLTFFVCLVCLLFILSILVTMQSKLQKTCSTVL